MALTAQKKKNARVLARDMAEALAPVGRKKGDIAMYEQLQFEHSRHVTGMAARSRCWKCFVDEYRLDEETVQHVWTRDDIYSRLNLSLCNELKGDYVSQFTLLLSNAIYRQTRSLPSRIYRGVDYSSALVELYEENAGEVIYLYSFAACSRSRKVAEGFGPWIMDIKLKRGNRDCVSDVSDASLYRHEDEIIISANAGYEIQSVNWKTKTIGLELVDESRCLRELPERLCGDH